MMKLQSSNAATCRVSKDITLVLPLALVKKKVCKNENSARGTSRSHVRTHRNLPLSVSLPYQRNRAAEKKPRQQGGEKMEASAAAAAAARTLRWAGRAGHLGGVPRAAVFAAVGACAKAYASLLNTTTVHNADGLLRLVSARPPGTPLLTVSNHMSTVDDPLMWGFKGFPITDAKLGRWVLTAEDICFKNVVMSYMFRLGKCIPITRGAGIYQEHMNEALDVLSNGGWEKLLKIISQLED